MLLELAYRPSYLTRIDPLKKNPTNPKKESMPVMFPSERLRKVHRFPLGANPPKPYCAFRFRTLTNVPANGDGPMTMASPLNCCWMMVVVPSPHQATGASLY